MTYDVSDQVNMKQMLLRVTNPLNKKNFIDIPVVVQISFRDPKPRQDIAQDITDPENGAPQGQEYVHDIDNSSLNGRTFRVERINNKTGTPGDVVENSDNYLMAEYPYCFPMYDPKSRGQQIDWICGNNKPWPAEPGDLKDGELLSAYRHVVRHTKDNTLEGTPWIEFEYIDVLPVYDPKTGGQVYIYRFRWYRDAEKGPAIPDDESPYSATFGKVDQTLERLPEDHDGINPEGDDTSTGWRFDPFKLAVNVDWGPSVLVVTLEESISGGSPAPIQVGTSFKLPAVPVVPAVPPKAGQAAIGSFELDFITPSQLPLDLAERFPIKNPITKDMRKGMLAWNDPGSPPPPVKPFFGVYTTARSIRTSLIINLERYSYGGQPSATFKFHAPGVGHVQNSWHVHVLAIRSPPVLGDIFQDDITVLGFDDDPTNASERQAASEALAISLGYTDIVESSITQLSHATQSTVSIKVTAATYSGRSDFDIDSKAVPLWDQTEAASTVVKTRSGGPMSATDFTFTVQFPTLKIV